MKDDMTFPGENDNELVQRVRSGDEEAFERLIKRHQTKVQRLLLRITGRSEDAEDILQDVFIAVYEKLDQFEGKAAFSTWLYRIAVNAALMRMRSRSRREEVPLESIPLERDIHEGEQDRAYDHLVTEQSLERIEKALGPLPYDFKTVFILRDIEGFSNSETAEIMDLSVPAVKSRLHRARTFLRQKLTDLYKETMEN